MGWLISKPSSPRATDIKSACRMDYFPAAHSSGTRNLEDIWWIVLHDEEAPTAQSAARYFQNPNSGGSAHLCLDDKICYRSLPNDAIPWGASSAIRANQRGFHIEQAGYAKWTGTVWRRKHLRTLQRASYKTALHCKRFGIPPVFVDADELLKGRHGVTTHAEVSKVSRIIDPGNASKYSHTDPGFGWPRRLFMTLVVRYYRAL